MDPGAKAAGPRGTGKAGGRKAAPSKAAGAKADSVKGPAGTKAAGTRADGVRPAGTKAAGTKAAGTKATGARPAGTKAAGTRATPAKATPAKATPAKATPAKAAPAKAAPSSTTPARPAGRPAAKATPRTTARAAQRAGDDKFLAEQRTLLLDERATYEEQAMALKAEADSLAEEMEPGDVQFDEESGEGGTTTVDRERDLALSAQAKVAIEEIDHALAKIEAGTYGLCERCHNPIPRPRLKALPYARLCVPCKSGGLSRR
ncbi:MAG: TraR/DksA C4-type zinc finger protein [Acidimicrobiales bacterium]